MPMPEAAQQTKQGGISPLQAARVYQQFAGGTGTGAGAGAGAVGTYAAPVAAFAALIHAADKSGIASENAKGLESLGKEVMRLPKNALKAIGIKL